MGIIDRLSLIFTKNKQTELGHLTNSIDDSLTKVVNVMNTMEVQSVISHSTGEWLDTWGSRFNVERRVGESDESYRVRILASVTDQKNTIPALISAVKRALGNDTTVTVKETYEDLRIWNVSTYSGEGKYQDSGETRLAVVRLTINKQPNQRLREEIYRTKASGVRVIIEQA